jgi:Cu2+-exporting ATPase
MMPLHDSWQDAGSSRHVIRDLGADLRETLLLIEGVRCTACVWLIERSLGACAGCGERAGQCSGAPRPGDLAGIEDHAAANCCRRYPAPDTARCRSTPVDSTICGAVSHATRSSGWSSPASARCRP